MALVVADVDRQAAIAAQRAADVVAALVHPAKATAAWSATTTAQATSIAKAHAAHRTHPVALPEARAHLTHKTTVTTTAHRKSACPKPHKTIANAKKATLPTHASASTCSAMACTCSPVRSAKAGATITVITTATVAAKAAAWAAAHSLIRCAPAST